jgi:hypothetical protein
MLISLHLGAHKTASTYIQKSLGQSRDRLRERGVGYLPLKEVRSAITKRLSISGWMDPVELRPATRRLLREHRSYDVLIISDENIIGGLKPKLGEYYYDRRRRVRRLLRAIGCNGVKVFFATRSYDTFISSMYCECIRHNPFLDAQSYVTEIDIESFSWMGVIGTFVGLVGAENVVVWPYEDFSLLERQVFASLTAGVADAIEGPPGRFRQSL